MHTRAQSRQCGSSRTIPTTGLLAVRGLWSSSSFSDGACFLMCLVCCCFFLLCVVLFCFSLWVVRLCSIRLSGCDACHLSLCAGPLSRVGWCRVPSCLCCFPSSLWLLPLHPAPICVLLPTDTQKKGPDKTPHPKTLWPKNRGPEKASIPKTRFCPVWHGVLRPGVFRVFSLLHPPRRCCHFSQLLWVVLPILLLAPPCAAFPLVVWCFSFHLLSVVFPSSFKWLCSLPPLWPGWWCSLLTLSFGPVVLKRS